MILVFSRVKIGEKFRRMPLNENVEYTWDMKCI